MRRLSFVFVIIGVTVFAFASAQVVNYPPPPGLVTSFDFAVKVNGQAVWTEKLESTMEIDSLPDWFLGRPYTQVPQIVHIANFSCRGPLSVSITARQPIQNYVIRPKSRKIQASVNGRTLEFSLPAPDKLYIEINDLPALLFFANPLEENAPKAGDPHVRYFGPGVHDAGEITLKDDDIIYIAGGALVYGALRGAPTNAKIIGRGILDGAYRHRLVLLENAAHVEFDGVILRNGRSWQNTLVNCEDVVYRNVKVISFGPSGDGINPVGSKNVTIENCFLRCTDDCIAVKAPNGQQSVENIHVINNTMAGFAFADGITIGFETNGPSVRNVRVSNCDILIARGGSRVDGHSAFSIICDGPARISDIVYENIRVEENVEKLFELNITDGTKYEVNPPGHIKGVHLRNIAWEIAKPILLGGFDANHLVEDVTFEDCTVAGQPLKAQESLIKQNEHVRGVVVK